MIRVRPFDSLSAIAVFRQLDPSDQLEAELVRGAPSPALDLFADWRAATRGSLMNLVAETAGGTPFAVLTLAHSGQYGVAEAALLARDHARFRRPLAELALAIRQRMPDWCAEQGVRRIEARTWAGHPTAARLLAAIGFACEADLPGFGPDGRQHFRQFAWISPATFAPAQTPPADPDTNPATHPEGSLL